MKKIISTTTSSFEKLREENLLYVDKTKQIYELLTSGDDCFFLSRPRRFGKSLLCSTLAELFSGNRELFKGLWIDGSDWKWDKHPVIHLGMIPVAGESYSIPALINKLSEILLYNANKFGVTIPTNQGPAGMLISLITTLHDTYNKKVVVIIDEYGKPIEDNISGGTHYEAVHKFMHNFYSQLKAADHALRFLFLTGVYKFAKTSIFSGLNHLRDLTFDPRASDLVGYTQEELESNFSNEIDVLATKMGYNRQQMLDVLREKYNGYHFGVDASTGELSRSVYNAFALNNVFADNALTKKWFESGSPSLLIEKIKEGNFELIPTEGVITSFTTLNTSCSPENMSAVSLLYYAGYATMQTYDIARDKVLLIPPNIEVASALSEQLLDLFKANPQSDLVDAAFDITDCFRNNHLDQLKPCLDRAFSQISYDILVKREKFFQMILFLLCKFGKLQTEAEVTTHDGRMDIVIVVTGRIFIVELKFNNTAQAGLDQIKDKGYAKKYVTRNLPVIGVGINFTLPRNKKNDSSLPQKTKIGVAWEQLV